MSELRALDEAIAKQADFIRQKERDLQTAQSRGATDSAALARRDLQGAVQFLLQLEAERRRLTPLGASRGGTFIGSNF